MFRKVTEQIGLVRDELRAIRGALKKVSTALKSEDHYESLRARLDALEGPLQIALGQVDARLAEAEALKRTARNAEERDRAILLKIEAEDEAPADVTPAIPDEVYERAFELETGETPFIVETADESEVLANLRKKKFG